MPNNLVSWSSNFLSMKIDWLNLFLAYLTEMYDKLDDVCRSFILILLTEVGVIVYHTVQFITKHNWQKEASVTRVVETLLWRYTAINYFHANSRLKGTSFELFKGILTKKFGVSNSLFYRNRRYWGIRIGTSLVVVLELVMKI